MQPLKWVLSWESHSNMARMYTLSVISRENIQLVRCVNYMWASQVAPVVKNPPANAGDIDNHHHFCQTSTWISHRHTYVPSLVTSLPPPQVFRPVSIVCFHHLLVSDSSFLNINLIGIKNFLNHHFIREKVAKKLKVICLRIHSYERAPIGLQRLSKIKGQCGSPFLWSQEPFGFQFIQSPALISQLPSLW